MAVGANGDIWFTTGASNSVGRLQLGRPPAGPFPLCEEMISAWAAAAAFDTISAGATHGVEATASKGETVATFIDYVRCGECSAGLTLGSESVVLQKYRRQPWLRHFWVRCDVCATHKLYWPTARQMSLAERLRCRTVTDESAPTDVTSCFARYNRHPVPVCGDRWAPVAILHQELVFLLGMLAATTSGPAPATVPALSYYPAHWSN